MRSTYYYYYFLNTQFLLNTYHITISQGKMNTSSLHKVSLFRGPQNSPCTCWMNVVGWKEKILCFFLNKKTTHDLISFLIYVYTVLDFFERRLCAKSPLLRLEINLYCTYSYSYIAAKSTIEFHKSQQISTYGKQPTRLLLCIVCYTKLAWNKESLGSYSLLLASQLIIYIYIYHSISQVVCVIYDSHV